MTADPTKTAVVLHQDRLAGLNSYFNRLRSHKTCLCCLLRAPEKVLACGHALCNVCISTLGVRSLEDKYTFILNRCPLCGTRCDYTEFQLVPPTAGIRLLSLDGGGIKGIISLVILRRLENLTSDLQVPLREHFDYVCGTSAGMQPPSHSRNSLANCS
jgi:hypothetical protein